jgi:hypothetical protein
MEPLDKSLDAVCLSHVLYIPTLQNNFFAVLHLVTSHCFHIVIEGTVMDFLRNGVRILTVTNQLVTCGSGPNPVPPEPSLTHNHSLDHRPAACTRRAAA